MHTRVGFVGLGTMGAHMAGHLVREGFPVTVWNRTMSKCQELRELGAGVARNLTELGATVEVCILCVNRAEDVVEVMGQLKQGAQFGTIFVDHSTISPEVTRDIHGELGVFGLHFMDAPVTGGSVGAEKGTLTAFCGGEREDFTKIEPVLAAYCKRSQYIGTSGSGQMMKMANQIAVGGALVALCEAMAFAKKAGLSLALTRELLNSGAAGSWAFENYGPMILKNDWTPGFSIANQRKDFQYCIEAAQSIDAAVPMTELVDHMLEQMEEAGRGEEATAALYELLVERGFGTWN